MLLHVSRRSFGLGVVVGMCLMAFTASRSGHGADHDTVALRAVELRCEYRVNPLGIDVENPRLNWRLESDVQGQGQAAYQILVASTLEDLEQGEADLWDTGRVEAKQTIHIEYAGTPLKSGQRCCWKVRSWPTKGHLPSTWSEPAWWEMSLCGPKEWQAQWINDGRPNPQDDDCFKEDPAPLFRKEFTLKKPVRRARLYITGLGYYDARLNGESVGDALLDPGWTDYAKRVYYSTFDVTDMFSDEPDQCLAVGVGNGWYNPLPLRMWGRRVIGNTLTTGRPRVIAQLDIEYEDGSTATIATDKTWKVAQGPMLRNSIYLGEVYDARREIEGWSMPGFDDADWSEAALAEEPVGPLQAQPLEPIRATATLKPVRVTEPTTGVFIYDMGQNFGGRMRLRLDVPAGTHLDLRYGELLNEDGTLNPRTSACGQIKGEPKFDEIGTRLGVWDPVYPSSAWQGDRYIAKGSR